MSIRRCTGFPLSLHFAATVHLQLPFLAGGRNVAAAVCSASRFQPARDLCFTLLVVCL
nr:hypothetical protein [Escherichia coli]